MKLRSAFFASMVMATTVMISASGSAVAQTAETDWTKRVTQSDKGGHVLGNPLAQHRLTEYMSYTCNHCANFDAEAHSAITANYVRKGHVSFEVRNLVLNPIDFTAAVLARCGGRTKFFGNHRAFLKQQDSWMKTFQSTPPEEIKALSQGDTNSRLKKIAKAADFYGLMKKRGYSKSEVNACLIDKAAQDRVVDMTSYATKTLKLGGTPSFTLNDKPLDKVHSWTSLQPRLLALPE